ncbi:glycerol-3-phosphate dehydrogenase [Desulfitispora alkaliphila]
MAVEKTEVVVIGGGATGTGILRDLSMRGVKAILVEEHDLAHGTSSRFHGLLHSGARYAVKDYEAAKECIDENKIMRKIGKGTCVEETEGLFVQLPGDDPAYADQWIKACEKAGITVKEIPVEKALELEPNINPQIQRAFIVPDAAVDGFRLVWANVESAERYGGKAYTYNRLDEIITNEGKVTGVVVTDTVSSQSREIECDYVINACGAWAGKVAALAGVDIKVTADKGTLIAFNHRLTSRVVNRLRKPGDGDIIVPHGTVSIFGTTSVVVDSPDSLDSTTDEVKRLMHLGREMFSNLEEFRVLRSFAGVRPLYQDSSASSDEGDGRAVSRGFALLDHKDQGVEGFVSIVGGKFTTYRLMAEKATDLICKQMANTKPCRTAKEELIPAATATQIDELGKYTTNPAAYKTAERWGKNVDQVIEVIKTNPWKGDIVCECEQVTLAEVELRAKERARVTLNDIRRKTRLGMGTCQGTICTGRAITQLYEGGQLTHHEVKVMLDEFIEGRWKGNRNAMWGEQVRQVEFLRNRYMNLYNVNQGGDNYEI